VKTQLIAIALVASLTVIGCSLVQQHKSQHDMDIDACTYGVQVPNNVRPEQREAFVHDVVASCMRTKGYSDADTQQ